MFKNKLITFRKKLGFTQQQMANMLNITRQGYLHYEKGTREPNLDTLKRLCIIFNCTSDELLEIDSNEQRKNVIINSFNNNSGKIDFKG